MIAPGASLGLLGGGQLGRMFAMAAQSMGYRVTVLDPGADSPAGTVADRHLQGDYLAAQGACLGRAGRIRVERDARAAVWIGGDSVSCIRGQVSL